MGFDRRKLRRVRKENRMTIKEAAEAIGVSEHTVAAWECNKRSPSEFNIEQICKVFSLEKSDLMDAKK